MLHFAFFANVFLDCLVVVILQNMLKTTKRAKDICGNPMKFMRSICESSIACSGSDKLYGKTTDMFRSLLKLWFLDCAFNMTKTLDIKTCSLIF